MSFLRPFPPQGSQWHPCMHGIRGIGENLLGLIKRHQNKGVPMHLVKQIAKQSSSAWITCIVVAASSTQVCFRFLPYTSYPESCLDLKPENVLICIDDVESSYRPSSLPHPRAPLHPPPSSSVYPPPRAGVETRRLDPRASISPAPSPSPAPPRPMAVVLCLISGPLA